MDAGTTMLRDFHRKYPGGASAVFAPGDCGDGRSSYEHLIDRVPEVRRVLDAGCGDGFLLERLALRQPDVELVGVDMSPEELACARDRLGASAELVEASLGRLPLPDASVDAVISHMVLMLVTDIEPALAELARVLAPGGVLAGVVGCRFEVPGPQQRLTERLWNLLDGEVGPPPSVGDPRFRTLGGLAELFSGGPWGAVRHTDLTTAVPVPLDETIEFLHQVW